MPSRSALRREEESRGDSDGMETMTGMAFLLRCSFASWTSEAVGKSPSVPYSHEVGLVSPLVLSHAKRSNKPAGRVQDTACMLPDCLLTVISTLLLGQCVTMYPAVHTTCCMHCLNRCLIDYAFPMGSH